MNPSHSRQKKNNSAPPALDDRPYPRFKRSSRFLGLVLLTLIGIWLGSSGLTTGTPSTTNSAATLSASELIKDSQAGAVNTSVHKTNTLMPSIPNICLPTDVNCMLNEAAKWAAQGILGVFQPITDALVQNSLNFITQTPICVYGCPTSDSPYQQNTTIETFVKWAVRVVNAAVAVFVVLGGYNIMIARQIGASYHEFAEFIPRLALAVIAANLCLFFLQFFIDLCNALCLEVINLFALTVLTDTIVGIFHGNLLTGGLLRFALAIILGVMLLLLFWQMLVRLALLFVLIVLSPLGLLCFALTQTQRYGQLWAATFAVVLFIQFFQVVTLAIGGMLISYTQTTNLLQLDQALISLFVSIAVMYLVLHIPGMIREWALRPVANAGLAAARAAGEAPGVAVRLIATFA